MKIKNKFILTVLFLSLIFTSGCSESSQLHRKLIVQGVGVDLEESSYKVTVEALDFQNPSGENEPSVKVFELYGNSVMEALSTVSMHTGLEPLYSQNLLLVIGEDAGYAGVGKVIDFFVRYYEARPNVKLCIAKGKASDILNHNPEIKTSAVRGVHDLIKDSMKSDIMHFIGKMRNPFSDSYCACLGISKAEDENAVIDDGISVFSGGALLGYLNKKETMGVFLINGISNPGSCSIDLNNSLKSTCRIDKVNSNIYPSIDSSLPKFDINIKVTAELFEVDKTETAETQGDLKFLIQEKLAEKLTQYCQQAISKSMELKSDIFNFGRILVNSNPEYLKSSGLNWKDIMSNCAYNVYIEPTITITGTEIIS